MDHPTKEEEAHFHFVLNDFEELLQTYGADYVLSKLRYPMYMQIYRHFDSME